LPHCVYLFLCLPPFLSPCLSFRQSLSLGSLHCACTVHHILFAYMLLYLCHFLQL
jgi:hypothetical protein